MSGWAIFSLLPMLALVSSGVERTPAYDYWIYKKTGSAVAIMYDGEPIKFLPDTGDGAYDRPIRTHPSHNYIFLDSRLTLEDAKSIMLFWMGWDPRTPIDFIVISEASEYSVAPDFRLGELPTGLATRARTLVGRPRATGAREGRAVIKQSQNPDQRSEQAGH